MSFAKYYYDYHFRSFVINFIDYFNNQYLNFKFNYQIINAI